MHQAQSWRANVDCQIIILDATADNVNMEEMRKVCKYVVAYTTKAAEKEHDSKKSMEELILKMELSMGGKSDIIKTVRKVLNMYTASKTISKQEAMVLMGKLKLYSCTEIMDHISTIKSSRRVVEMQATPEKAVHLVFRFVTL